MVRGATLSCVAALIWSLAAPGVLAATVPSWVIATTVKKLANGLTVVVTEDHTAPTFGISVVYKVGFRLEPRGRSGFAHLFEHMMFQGTPNTPKGAFDRIVEGGGGVDNGSTCYDYTNYIASAPVSALEPVLWLEADRMRMLDFSEESLANQRDVVKEEIRVNVTNRPYGLFFWTDLVGLTFDKWENAHDGYGSFADLDAATIQDVKSFHRTYYAPNNAVIGIAGDVDTTAVLRLVDKHFGGIPAQAPPPPADVTEELGGAERALTQNDQFAQVPAVAIGYRMPDPGSRDYIPAWVLGELLLAGDASRLYQGLVKGQELLIQVQGGMGWPLGDAVSNGGPSMLVVFGLTRPATPADRVVGTVQKELDRLARGALTGAEVERVKIKMISDFYTDLEPLINRADRLAVRQALTGDAASLNHIPAQINDVTPADLTRVAGTYLTVQNRSWINRLPARQDTR